ncbi:DUF554 domain-containing protein [Bacillaceae bacterium]
MVLLGTIVNALAIIVGAFVGSRLRGVKKGVRDTVMHGLGLAVLVLGIMMALKTEHFLLVIVSLVIGAAIGEWIGVEERLNRLGQWVEAKAGEKGEGNAAAAFVMSTLIYCIGAMAILGALDSGLRQDHSILYTKSMLDGFTAIIFASTMGIGVVFSAIPVFLYQGSIALLSSLLGGNVNEAMLRPFINDVTATGGIMIMAIGLNILQIKKINVANLLPALLVVAIAVPLFFYAERWLPGLFG